MWPTTCLFIVNAVCCFKIILKHFFDGLDKYSPNLVSWNGSGFDLPVLNYRMLANKISSEIYFDTGENPAIYNNFASWETFGKIILYKRLRNPKGRIEEEIYISNNEYDLKLGAFFNEIEEVEDGKPEEETE